MARLTVTLNDDLYAAITRLADLQGCTKSSLINEFMGAAIPAMNNVSSVIEHLRTATEAEKQAFKSGVGELADIAQSDLDRLGAQVDMFSKGYKLKLI